MGVLRIGVGLSDRACVGLSWQDKSKLTNELPCVSLSLGTFDIFLYSHEQLIYVFLELEVCMFFPEVCRLS